MQEARGSKPSDGLTEEKIREAIRRSGYPLEIRLAKQFEDAKMEPILGWRVGSPRTPNLRDMDLLVALNEPRIYEVFEENQKVTGVLQMSMHAMIQVKGMPAGMAFVGFPWRQPTTHEARVMRSFTGGCPASRARSYDFGWNAISTGGDDSVIAALDPLNESATVCHQWSVVHMPGGRKAANSGIPAEYRAEHLTDYADDISNVAEATEWLLRERTTPSKDGQVSFIYPTLIVGTPSLYLFDVHSGTLRTTDWLIYEGTFDFGEGRAETRYVDVVTEAGVPKMIERHKRAFAEMVERLTLRAGEIRASAKNQSSKMQLDKLNALVEEREAKGLRTYGF